MFENLRFDQLNDLIECLYSFDEGFVFRGQCNASWGLTSTMERILEDSSDYKHDTDACESTVKDIFKSRIHHYLHRDEQPASELGWLSIAQHHGAPTRLLDFTRYPLVALYFASRSVRSEDSDFAIWAVNYRSLNDDCEKLIGTGVIDSNPDGFFSECELLNSNSAIGAWIGEPRKVNLRLERQGGTFLIPSNRSHKIEDSLAQAFKRSRIAATKITISSDLVHEVYNFLSKSGISASRLFDGVDGLAQEVSEELYRVLSKPAL